MKKHIFTLLVLALCNTAVIHATSFSITTGTNATGRILILNETGFISNNAGLSTAGVAVTINGNNASITNLGLLISTSDRAIRTQNGNTTGFSITNGPLATLKGGSDDGLQVRGGGSTFTLHNAGLFSGGTSGQALDLDSITAGNSLVVNYSGGTISATNADAIRPGSNNTLTNDGSIFSTTGDAYDSQINTNSRIYNYGMISGSQKGLRIVSGIISNTGTIISATEEGIAFSTNLFPAQTNNWIYNSGTITGGTHGIETKINIAITNQSGAFIIGRSGSGINVDGFSNVATVVNFGTIKGNTNSPTADGDGIDIDGAATIYNYGFVQAKGNTGAMDGNSEGFALGGGFVTNSGSISGQARGIQVDDGNGNAGVSAIVIHNTGSILGENEYAIKIAGNFNNTITNYSTGSITGNGAVGVGAAIQFGGGDDRLVNAGTISGTNGLAVDMGGGNDEIILKQGSTINGALDGGTGGNTLKFDAGTGNAITVNFNITNFSNITLESGTVQGTATLGNLTLQTGTALKGTLSVGQISGSGSVDPGNSPGISTAASIDPTGGLDFNFEYTGAAPDFLAPMASINDVSRITGFPPFTAPMTGANVISIYLNVAGLNNGDIYTGGFFTDNAAGFFTSISGASFAYYLADVAGSVTYNSINYSALDSALWTIDRATIAQTADFGAGNVNGQIMQLTVQAVPEPSAYALLGCGAGLVLIVLQRKLRNKSRKP